MCFSLDGKHELTAGSDVVDAEGTPIGRITSAAIDPTKHQTLIMGLLPRKKAEGKKLYFAETGVVLR